MPQDGPKIQEISTPEDKPVEVVEEPVSGGKKKRKNKKKKNMNKDSSSTPSG